MAELAPIPMMTLMKAVGYLTLYTFHKEHSDGDYEALVDDSLLRRLRQWAEGTSASSALGR
jgi:hypothetical protein